MPQPPTPPGGNLPDPTKLAKITTALGGVKDSLENASGVAQSFFASFGGLDLSISSIIALALEIDNLRAEMSKTTGGAEGLGTAMGAAREHVKGLAMRFQDMSKHVATAYENIAIFSEVTDKAKGKMLGAAASLTKLGIDAATTSKNINTMTKGLGMSVDEAFEVSMNIAKVSKSLGSFMTPAKMAEEFGRAAPKLAAYGKNMEREFYKLAAQSKATGMEMSGLLGVAGKFDTFEDAANTTAQLNALMGTQLNSVDMLTASEGERIEMLKESIAASGKSWETMDRFERKALAGAVGMSDLSEAGKLFGTSMEEMDEAAEAADPALTSQEELNEAMKKGVSIGEGFAAMIEGIKLKLAKVIMPHVMKFFKWMTSAPKGEMSPLDHMVKTIEDFAGLVDKHLFKPFGKFWDSLDKEEKGGFAKVMGIVLAMGPIIGVLGTAGLIVGGLIGPVTAIMGVIGTIFGIMWAIGGAISAAALWPVVIIAAIVAMGVVLYNEFDKVKYWIDELLIEPLKDSWEWIKESAASVFEWIGSLIEGIFGPTIGGKINDWFSSIGDKIMDFFGLIGPWFTDEVINKAILAINLLMTMLWDMMPAVALKGLAVMGMDSPPQIDKLHEGGPLLGPAILRTDEYLIIPPKGAEAGEVLTPQQAAKTDDKPVTVVINIDGREFVRQTVFPALNKEFNLQGIG